MAEKKFDLTEMYTTGWKDHSHYSPAEAMCFRAQDIIKQEMDIVIPWRVISKAIFGPLTDFARMAEQGDTVELPPGAVLIMAFKPKG